MKPITPHAATRQGFLPLAGPYTREERLWMDRVIHDLNRGFIDYRIVYAGQDAEGNDRAEVWRTKEGFLMSEERKRPRAR